MKVLFIEWESFGNEDVKEAFLAEGYALYSFPFTYHGNARNDPLVENRLSSALHRETPDMVFSLGYFPVISKVCQREGVRYIAWDYDCPDILLYSHTIVNPCNIVYVFDRELYLEFQKNGVRTVRYLPMAANTDRLDSVIGKDLQEVCDVSFVGSLYTEKYNNLPVNWNALSDYAKGYIDALSAAQRKVQGYNFIQDVLSPVINDLYKAYPMDPNEDGFESREWFYAQYIVNRRITAQERMNLLYAVACQHTLDLFTTDESFTMPNLRNHGSVDYYNEMPKVFRKSRINLNISLRSIKSGIPLRAFDVMGSEGFLISNYQADFMDYFVPGEDFVYYENREDLLDKIDYYLDHEEERRIIAKNGHDKIAAEHTYRHRVREMLEAVW